jgi:hypothetical protein
MCGLLSEGHDVTLVLLQGWVCSYSFSNSWRSFIYGGVSHIEGGRRECPNQVSAAVYAGNADGDEDVDESTSIMGMMLCYVLKLLCCGVVDWERVAL